MPKTKTAPGPERAAAGLTAILVEKLKVVERNASHVVVKRVKKENIPAADQLLASVPREATGAKNLKKLIRKKSND